MDSVTLTEVELHSFIVTPWVSHILFMCACLRHALCVSGVQKNKEEIIKEMVKVVRDTIGPVAAFRKVLFVRALPKTRSGKIPRASLANLVNGKPYKV